MVSYSIVYILSFESVLLPVPFLSCQQDCRTIFSISIIFFHHAMNILLFLFHAGFFAAALRSAERSLCTQFVPTLRVSMSLQLVEETSLQGNEKQTWLAITTCLWRSLLSFAVMLPTKYITIFARNWNTTVDKLRHQKFSTKQVNW